MGSTEFLHGGEDARPDRDYGDENSQGGPLLLALILTSLSGALVGFVIGLVLGVLIA